MRLLNLVYGKIVFYYRELYGTRRCYRHPLSLWRLAKLCNRSNRTVVAALHYLANTIPVGSHTEPPIYYDRTKAMKNKSHRPYRIFPRKKQDSESSDSKALNKPPLPQKHDEAQKEL